MKYWWCISSLSEEGPSPLLLALLVKLLAGAVIQESYRGVLQSCLFCLMGLVWVLVRLSADRHTEFTFWAQPDTAFPK